MARTIAIATDLRRVVAEIVAPWRAADIYAAGSADLVLERVARAATSARVHGSGAGLVAAAAGSYAAGLPLRIAPQPSAAERLAFIAPALEDPAGAVAAVLVVRQFAQALARESFFYQRYVEGLRRQWPQLHAKALARLAADALRLDSYIVAGAAELLGMLPPDAAVLAHAGTWRPDARREALLSSIFDWDAPTTADLGNDALRAETIAALVDRDRWLLITSAPSEELAPFLRAQVQASVRGVTHYVHAPDGATRLVSPHQQLAPLRVPRLTVGTPLSGDLTLAPIPTAQFNSLRSAYLNAAIRPGGATAGLAGLSVAVLVGQHLIGAYALSFDPQLCTIADGQLTPPAVYLMSDFAVGPTDEPRLSKLVVMAALSHEARLLAERRLAQRWRSLVTTAFSQHPVSMKYRGVMTLITRAETSSPDLPGGRGYKLTYGGALGAWTLAEALASWRAKHARKEEPRGERYDSL